MRRRDILAGLLSAWAVSPTQAQSVTKTHRIVFLSIYSGNDDYSPIQAFWYEMRQLGYVEGQTLEVERYYTEGSSERREEIAQDAVRRKPDLLFVITGPLAQHVRNASATTPIVCITADPIALGLTTSLAQPSGNVTGVVVDTGIEAWGKRLQLLKEIAPTAFRVGFLARKAVWEGTETPAVVSAVRTAAKTIGVDLFGVPIDSPIEEAAYKRAFEIISKDWVEALIVQDAAENLFYRKTIIELVEKRRIPAVYPFRDFAKIGGLITYAVDLFELYRHAAKQIGQILNGAPLRDVPFYESKSFQLILNAKGASVLGLQFPPTLLARADEVIE
jgi:putative tryptophan/tyrosine transport system substrate-binding protein